MINDLGKCSTFGGPHDGGVAADENLALCEPGQEDLFPANLFLPYQPPGTTGTARKLNPDAYYIAMRWDYSVTPQRWLRNNKAMVRALKTNLSVEAQPIDWGPNSDTGRVADLSPGVCRAIGVSTNDTVQVTMATPNMIKRLYYRALDWTGL